MYKFNRVGNPAVIYRCFVLLSSLVVLRIRTVRGFIPTASVTAVFPGHSKHCRYSIGVVPSSLQLLVPSLSSCHNRHYFSQSIMDKNDGSASALAATTSSTTTAAAAVDNKNINHENNEDPYLWLEDIESTESLDFAKACNEQCLKILGNPETKSSYARILSVLESEDRIPGVTQYGILEKNQERILVNFWKDAEHPKGIWRQTSLESYRTKDPSWHILLDLDQLAEQDQMGWVWKGATPLPRGRDSSSSNMNRVTRALLQLSNGGSDAIHIREFDLFDGAFVVPDDQAFHINVEGKTRISYKSRNITYVGSSVFGSDAVTDSGYPRTVHEWVRGTPLEQAPKIWEGETADVSVGMYIVDERTWNGGIYEVRYRSITFYKTLYWMRKISAEQLEIPNQQQGNDVSSLDFTKVDIPEDASISFLGKMFIISLRSDWSPDASSDNDDESASKTTYKQGSVIITQIDHFLKHGAANSTYTILFEPTERTAYEYFTASKNYLVLSIMDNVKSKLQFFKIDPDGDRLEPIGYVPEPQIRDCSIRPVDAYSGLDDFWFETSDFVTPSSLFLVDANKILELPHDDESSPSAPDYITRGEQPLKSLPEQYNADNLVVEQRMATSKDGTKIPYFIIYQKDIILDGSNPTLLYAYGGFEVSQTPHYIASAGLAWLERGGVYIEANIRGGGEFGPAWHQSALREKRHKCYEDFAAVAEHLIASNICSPQTLAGRGGSNGGLLMGYMYTKYPHLFGAIHCAVPLLDMQRYHKLLAGASWMAEYGNPDTEDWISFLKGYSPYHNIDPNANYPPILVTTSTRDDRVHPGHARKFVKKLVDMNKEWKVYYYENIEGGHGGAANAKQSAFMLSLAYDFMFDTLTKNKENLPN